MEFEPPTIDDVDELTDLWVALAREQRAHGSRLLPEANRSAINDAMARSVVTGGAIVARTADDGIAGFVTFQYAAGSYETDVVRGIVQNLYVRPEYRGERIGTSLLDRAESELAEAGTDVVSVEAMAANEDALRFYRARDYDSHRIRLEKRLQAENHSKDDG